MLRQLLLRHLSFQTLDIQISQEWWEFFSQRIVDEQHFTLLLLLTTNALLILKTYLNCIVLSLTDAYKLVRMIPFEEERLLLSLSVCLRNLFE